MIPPLLDHFVDIFIARCTVIGGISDIDVTLNAYTHLSLEDAQDEMIHMEELNGAK